MSKAEQMIVIQGKEDASRTKTQPSGDENQERQTAVETTQNGDGERRHTTLETNRSSTAIDTANQIEDDLQIIEAKDPVDE